MDHDGDQGASRDSGRYKGNRANAFIRKVLNFDTLMRAKLLSDTIGDKATAAQQMKDLDKGSRLIERQAGKCPRARNKVFVQRVRRKMTTKATYF